jgi:hypothetical protein
MSAIIVSPEDEDLLAAHKWQFDVRLGGYVYASRTVWKDGVSKKVYLHRLIAGAGPGQHVDHVNRNTLDNRRGNLRICSASQNQANRGLPRTNTSGAKGVHWVPQNSCWRAQITVNGRKINLGRFQSLAEAQRAYDEAARRHFGDFARSCSASDSMRGGPNV